MNLKNTLEPVVTVQDIKHKWGLKDDRTAKKYMLAIPHLKAYRNLAGELVCERQYFDEVMEELLKVGDMRPLEAMSMMICRPDNWGKPDNWAKTEMRKAGMSEQQIQQIIGQNRKRR